MKLISEILDNIDKVGLLVFGFGCLMAGITIGQILYARQVPEMQQKAVERNAAEWVVDQKTGDTTFKWKEIAQ